MRFPGQRQPPVSSDKHDKYFDQEYGKVKAHTLLQIVSNHWEGTDHTSCVTLRKGEFVILKSGFTSFKTLLHHWLICTVCRTEKRVHLKSEFLALHRVSMFSFNVNVAFHIQFFFNFSFEHLTSSAGLTCDFEAMFQPRGKSL